MNGACRLAWQKGPRALFAEVHVTVDVLSRHEDRIDIPEDTCPSWTSGIRFGFERLRESLWGSEGEPAGLHVIVREVRGQPVDTSVASMAYATFHAIKDAIDADVGARFVFDENTGRFHL